MRLLRFGILSLIISLVITPMASAKPEVGVSRIVNRDSPLQLTASVTNQRYCKGDGEYDSLRLTTHLRFKNVSDQRVILYKGSNTVIRTTVGSSVEDIENERLLDDLKFSVYTQGGYDIDTPSPGQAFIILPPGGSFEKDADTVVMVSKKAKVGAVMPGGKYYMQVTVSTFHETEDLARQLYRRWKSYGELWFDPISSMPVRLNVPANRDKSDCKTSP
jgi:hypothetical protein